MPVEWYKVLQCKKTGMRFKKPFPSRAFQTKLSELKKRQKFDCNNDIMSTAMIELATHWSFLLKNGARQS